ncbi:hypothetical protein SPRG_12589 [Saprolegnia parasitica CBS 223.65]|uniref:Uncharacterized protein n=1 Tax=Saprolegnia parasitica (strain CBS 223.65) TaxID=695850 RepID=A0A067BVR2_SAPPC|nr:hypothetical protein SPRG_12589 [Saprolegnia parasitica CBS 223.65]KDO22609.1 hypothetical protein SPRG_12589 [Saprolegnia parasitica CBS 223.65]|eukprot:XP_012206724.1 hypothetical protein SPRG_12589 [Saprolegnia parasitica CBS 223.65]
MSPQPQEAASLFGDDDTSSAWGLPVAPPSPAATPALVTKPVASPVFKSQASPLQRSVTPPPAPHVASPRPQEASSLFSDASSLFGPSSPVSQFSAAAKSPSPVSQFVARSPSPRPLEAASLFGTASPRRDEALFVTKPSAQEMQPVHEPAPVSSTTSLFSNNPPSREAAAHYPSFSAASPHALASGSSPMQHAAPPAYTPPTTASFAQPRTPEHRPTSSTLPGGKQGTYSPAKPAYGPPRTPELGPTTNLPTPMYSSNGQASSSVVSQPQALGHSPKHLSTAHAQPAAFAPPAATDSEARALGSSSWHHVAPPVYTPPKTMSAPPRTPELRSAPRTPVRGAPSADSPSFSLPATAAPVPRPRPKLRLNLESSMDKLSVASSPLHPALLPTPPRSTSRYVPLSPANSVRSDCSASTAGVYQLMTQYKAMAERLEKEKAELLQILTQQAEQFYAMQAYIEELQSARDAQH